MKQCYLKGMEECSWQYLLTLLQIIIVMLKVLMCIVYEKDFLCSATIIFIKLKKEKKRQGHIA